MFDLGFAELMVIGVVALIVVGPKDLPGMFRTVGQYVGKAKGMAREFSSAMNAAADEAGVSEINKTIKAAANPKKFGVDKIREATKMEKPDADAKPENETDKLRAKMTDERKATAKKMSDAMAKAATDRQAKEAAVAAKPAGKAAPKAAATAKAAAPKAKAAAKKAPAKKAPDKKPAAKKAPAKPKKPAAAKDTK